MSSSHAGDADLVAFADWLSERAEKETPPAPPDPERLYVSFTLADKEYGLPIASVREILRVGEISRVPQAPPHIRGVMNVRGRILPIVELRARLGLDRLSPGPDARVVVVEVRERSLGLLVDRVTRVARVKDSTLAEAAPELAAARAGCASAVAATAEGALVLLDPEKALGVKG